VTPNEKTPELEREETTYAFEKITFVVTPVYNENSNTTIHDIVLSLILKDGENP
jgi:hypothetical protein